MITQIEDAIVSHLKAKLGAGAGTLAVQRGVEGIPQPAVYVSTEAGKFEKVAQQSYRHDVTVFVDIVFSSYADEGERRKGVYLILQGVVQALLLQNLGLTISPLAPRNWKNSTSEELRKKGLIVFSLELATSFVVKKLDDEAAADLLRVGLEYYLQDPEDDGNADASDEITLQS